jgi:hypothetical protein
MDKIEQIKNVPSNNKVLVRANGDILLKKTGTKHNNETALSKA